MSKTTIFADFKAFIFLGAGFLWILNGCKGSFLKMTDKKHVSILGLLILFFAVLITGFFTV